MHHTIACKLSGRVIFQGEHITEIIWTCTFTHMKVLMHNIQQLKTQQNSFSWVKGYLHCGFIIVVLLEPNTDSEVCKVKDRVPTMGFYGQSCHWGAFEEESRAVFECW